MTTQTRFDWLGETIVAGFLAAALLVGGFASIGLASDPFSGSMTGGVPFADYLVVVTILGVVMAAVVGVVRVARSRMPQEAPWWALQISGVLTTTTVTYALILALIQSAPDDPKHALEILAGALIVGLIIHTAAELTRYLRSALPAWSMRRRVAVIAVLLVLTAGPAAAAAGVHNASAAGDSIIDSSDDSSTLETRGDGMAAYDDGHWGPHVFMSTGSLVEGHERGTSVDITTDVTNENVPDGWFHPTYNVSQVKLVDADSSLMDATTIRAKTENGTERVPSYYHVDLPDSWRGNVIERGYYADNTIQDDRFTHVSLPYPYLDEDIGSGLVMENVESMHVYYDVVNDDGEIVRYIFHIQRATEDPQSDE